MNIIRRLLLGGVGAVTAGVLAAGPALAHECFNTQWSDQASDMIASHSNGWFDIQTWQFIALGTVECEGTDCPPSVPGTEALASVPPDLLVGVILGFVPEEALSPFTGASEAYANLVEFTQAVATYANENFGVPTHYLTNAHTTLAGGAERSGRDITSDGRGIDHFPDVYVDDLIASFMAVAG